MDPAEGPRVQQAISDRVIVRNGIGALGVVAVWFGGMGLCIRMAKRLIPEAWPSPQRMVAIGATQFFGFLLTLLITQLLARVVAKRRVNLIAWAKESYENLIRLLERRSKRS